MQYTWNDDKAELVKKQHKVEFSKLVDIFEDPYALEFIDETHSTENEIRFGIIGLTVAYGLVSLIFTEPAEDELHFITARRAENWMAKEYEENRKF
jgi:uncharacterized DUF497 family protein